jgi:hypothetical protein
VPASVEIVELPRLPTLRLAEIEELRNSHVVVVVEVVEVVEVVDKIDRIVVDRIEVDRIVVDRMVVDRIVVDKADVVVAALAIERGEVVEKEGRTGSTTWVRMLVWQSAQSMTATSVPATKAATNHAAVVVVVVVVVAWRDETDWQRSEAADVVDDRAMSVGDDRAAGAVQRGRRRLVAAAARARSADCAVACSWAAAMLPTIHSITIVLVFDVFVWLCDSVLV